MTTFQSKTQLVRQEQFAAAERYFRIYYSTWQHLTKARAVRRLPGGLTDSARHRLMTSWANEMLSVARMKVVRKGAEPSRDPVIFVGNHVGYLDIPVLMSVTPVVFVAKKELGSWPIFGSAIKTVGTVLVERDSRSSRITAAEAIARSVLEKRQSVAIFPAGTTTLDERKEWRRGSFQIARQYGIPIQPFRLRFKPLREVAFIDDDAFIPHLWKLIHSPCLEASIEFNEPFQVEEPTQECRKWWQWSREGL